MPFLMALVCFGCAANMAHAADPKDGIEVLKLRPNFFMIAGRGRISRCRPENSAPLWWIPAPGRRPIGLLKKSAN